MRKNYIYAMASFALVLAGCSKKEMSQLPEQGVTVITATAADTKTALGEDGVSVVWSIGDKIKINDKSSAALAAEDITSPSKAMFSFAEEISAPYYAVYSAEKSYAFENLGLDNARCKVELKNPQSYVEGSYDPMKAILCGVNAQSAEISFSHAMSYVKITPTAGSAPEAKIASVSLTSRSGSENLAGRFYLNFSDGLLTEYTSHENFAVMNAPEAGVELGKAFIIAIPPQAYAEGLTARITAVDGSFMERNIKSFTAVAGKLYHLETSFNPTGSAVPAVATAAEVTSSTVCFTWTFGVDVATDIAAAWTIQCSASSDFANATEFTIPEGSASTVWKNVTPKFCFGGLEQGKTYYFRVKTTEGAWSNTASATTTTYDKTVVSSAAKVGDVILAEDFAALNTDGEIVSKAAGYRPFGTPSFQNKTASYTIANNDKNELPETLRNWGFARGTGSANLYANSGHFKLGTSSAQGYLVTPELNAIPENNNATLEITLTLAVYPDDANNVEKFFVSSETGSMSATNLFTCNNAMANKVEGDLTENTKWITYTVELSNVKHGDRLMIGATNNAKNNRLLINDVKAKIVGLEAISGRPKVTEIELVQVDRTFATIKWGNIASSIGEKSTYVLQVYKDEACTQPVYNRDVITYDVPFSRYSPFGTSAYIGKKNSSNVAPTELKISCGLLQPDTDYWFRVKPIDESIVVDGAKTKTGSGTTTFSNTVTDADWSDAFHFKTAPARVPAPNEVIYTGFDALSIGPNMENLSAGVAAQFTWETGLPATAAAKSERYAFLTDFAAGNYSKGWCTWACDRCNQGQGQTFGSVVSWWGFCDDTDALYLDGTTKNVTLNGSSVRYNRLGKVGDITGWYLSSQTFPGMGHVFMNDVGNFVGTPALTTNLSGTATACTVRIKAAKVRNNGNADDITIKAYKFDGSTLNTTTPVATITIGGKSCYKDWSSTTNYTTDFTTRDYSFDIDLKSGEALVFAVSSFAIIDEIQIVKK